MMKSDSSILVIDDEQSALAGYRLILKAAGFEDVTICRDSRQASSLLAKKSFDLMLLDLTMPGVPGEEVLSQTHRLLPDLPIVIVTASDDAGTAVRCIRAGAYDYLVKPVDKERLVTTVTRTLEAFALRRENQKLKKELLSPSNEIDQAFASIITRNSRMLSIFRYMTAIAQSDEPVLITGETGVGKELCAEALHRLSGRQGEYVTVNAAGLDEQMFSDALFGHKRGAYTGAAEHRDGLFQKAMGGTIFLDEIGDIPGSLQTKLLRVLESGEYYSGGCDTPSHTDARVIAATNRSREELGTGAKFRRDLFYRLNVHHIEVPPLRERPDDIPLLAAHFARQAAGALDRDPPALSEDILSALASYSWPGNVRELKATILDVVSRATEGKTFLSVLGERIERNLPSASIVFQAAPQPAVLPTIRQSTEALVREAMARSGGNQRKAAAMLGISQPALSKRLKNMPDL